MQNNSLKKINSTRFTSNAGRSLAALSGFLTGTASKTKVLSGVVSLGIALIAGMSLLSSEKAIATDSRNPVTINAVFDFSTFPDVDGTFTTSGALTISGDATMHVGLNANGTIAHCVIVLIASDGSGTITIHQECQFATSPPKGRWEIVSGTGDYADLRGNGSLLMPPNAEDMTGVIY